MNSSPGFHATLTQLRTLNREQLQSALLKWVQPAILTLAVIGIAWQLAQLTWLIFQPKSSATPVPVVASPAITQHSTLNTQAIADAHLFGIASAEPRDDANNLQPTQINLVLAGTMAFNDPKEGFAIVGDNAVNAKFYRVGATINGSIRLYAVYTDHVIIDRAGALETLSLPHGPSIGGPPPSRPGVNSGAQFSDNIRRLANNSPNTLAQMIRVQPVFSNGTQKGYRVYPGRERAQFTRLGLQAGDLITSINGTLLNDPGVTNDILGLLSSSSSVMVSIERNGNPMTLNLDISQISLPEENPAGTPPPEATGDPGATAPMNRTRVVPPNSTLPSAQ
ncbi:MAG: type II secretion system protein GspC [Steroidobacter sp.]